MIYAPAHLTASLASASHGSDLGLCAVVHLAFPGYVLAQKLLLTAMAINR